MIWLTSDLHFCHNRDFIYKARGFENVQAMNEKIISNFWEVIDPEDDLYILGDCFLNDDYEGMKCMRRLPGRLHIAIGNHDSDNRIMQMRTMYNLMEIGMGYRLKRGKKQLILTHYPTMVANKEDKTPVFNLHGHTHQTSPYNKDMPQCYNVGVDTNGCMPVSLDKVIEDIDKARMRGAF